MKSISNMQNNCKELNDCVRENYPDTQVDYCEMKTFDAISLTKAIRCSPFLGYSGYISFTNRSYLRFSLPMNIYQIQSNQKVVKIGNFTDRIGRFFGNEQFFGSNQTPESGNKI